MLPQHLSWCLYCDFIASFDCAGCLIGYNIHVQQNAPTTVPMRQSHWVVPDIPSKGVHCRCFTARVRCWAACCSQTKWIYIELCCFEILTRPNCLHSAIQQEYSSDQKAALKCKIKSTKGMSVEHLLKINTKNQKLGIKDNHLSIQPMKYLSTDWKRSPCKKDLGVTIIITNIERNTWKSVKIYGQIGKGGCWTGQLVNCGAVLESWWGWAMETLHW